MSKEVAEIVGAMSAGVASRHVAAEILQKVAEHGSFGSFPSDVTCEEAGRALFRIAMNSPSRDPLMDIMSGYRAAEAEYQRRAEESHNESVAELHRDLRRLNPRWPNPPR